MTDTSHPAPAHQLHAMLAFQGADQAINFYQQAFGAVEFFRLNNPDGTIAHAQLKIGEALFMLAEENPQFNCSPMTAGTTTVVLHLTVPDVDTFVEQAVSAGAQIVIPVKDQFYGERAGRIADPFGYLWAVSSHVENVSVEEMQRRFDAMTQGARPA